MREFIEDNRLLIISGVLIVAFLGYAFTQNSSATDTNPPGKDSFRAADVASPMYKGSKDATATIIQYSDFLCPSCSIFSTEVMPSIEKTYVEAGKANYEFRPMAFIADGSLQAGMGGYCAIDQGKFWPYHDNIYAYVANEIFKNNKDPKSDVILTASLVKDIATSSGLDSKSFDSCLDSKEHLDDIQNSTNTANRNGVNSTPYILVDGQEYQGNMTLSAFEALLKAKI